MAAIRQRRELLEQTQKAFSLRCKNFLSSKFLFHVSLFSYEIIFRFLFIQAEGYGERFELGGNELPRHGEKITKPLLPFSPLCQWLKLASPIYFKEVCQVDSYSIIDWNYPFFFSKGLYFTNSTDLCQGNSWIF